MAKITRNKAVPHDTMPPIPDFLLVKNHKRSRKKVNALAVIHTVKHDDLPALPEPLRYAVTQMEEDGFETDKGVVPVRWASDPSTVHSILLRVMRQRKPPDPDKPAKPARVKIDRSGLIHVSVIAQDLKIDPKLARRALRATMKKPDTGWHFPPADIKSVKEKIASWISKQQELKSVSPSRPVKSSRKNNRTSTSASKTSPKTSRKNSKKSSSSSQRKRRKKR